MAILQRFFNWFVGFMFNNFEPKVKFAKKFSNAIDPTCRKDGSLGFDLYTPERVEIESGERLVIDTGIIFEFPYYLGMYVWDKSSVALKKYLTVCGGVIDPGYSGSIGVILQNSHSKKIVLPKGTAIAQVVFHLAIRPSLIDVERTEISESVRGERGFGGDWIWYIPRTNGR